MRDLFSEIMVSLRRNRMRTALTGFSVTWGIFMLIALLGTGRGLFNAFSEEGDNFASNTMKVGGGWTSKPYDGLRAGRRMVLEDKDIEFVAGRQFADHIDHVTATVGKNVTVVRGPKHYNGYIEGNYPDRRDMDKIVLREGRFINRSDIEQRRKVIVLPDTQAEFILQNGEKPTDLVGQNVKVDGISFKVVGISKGNAMRSDMLFYAPFTTVRTIFSKGKEIDDLTFSFHGLADEKQNEEFEKSFKSALNLSHRAAPDDESAFWIWNRFMQNLQMEKGSRIISIALWIIGIFTLLGGIVGVSNIMLITVQERTHEFGIRKAIGATPWKITSLIMTESITITILFGYIGMILGLVTCEVLDAVVGANPIEFFGESMTMLKNPSVGVGTALMAVAVLVIAGTLAGLAPAINAAKVKPVEALRKE